MAFVKRYDAITLDKSKAIRLDNGMMKVPARVGKVGVQNYINARGEVERVYRPADEVFKADSIATFDGVALVNDHPTIDNSTVTAKNVKRLQVGTVMNPAADGDYLGAMLMIADADAVALVDAGKQQLSCGYFCERVKEAGVYTDAEGMAHPYDFVQRNIRGNHVAIVDVGRAGPDVRIQLDSEAAVMTEAVFENKPASGPKVAIVEKLTVDGFEFEISPLGKTVLAKRDALTAELLKQGEAKVAELQTKCDKQAAVCDSQAGEIKQLKADLDAAPAKLKAAADARAALNSAASNVLGKEIKLDSMSAAELRLAVIKKASPEIKLEGKSEAYLDAAFDLAVESYSKRNLASEAVAAEIKSVRQTAVTTDTAPVDVAAAKQKMNSDFFNPKK